MTKMLTRRRLLTISAATMASAGLPVQAREVATWAGRAMGAQARMTLAGSLPKAELRSVFLAVEQELARLERIFSLYDLGSQIVQLNKAGILKAPAPELLEVLSLCDVLHTASKGAFDPTLQPQWQAHATATSQGRLLSPNDLTTLRAKVGWRHLHFDAGEVRFDGAGRGLTLNGVAQGYVTDQIAALLRQRGLVDVLIDIGEVAALGKKTWTVGIAMPDGKIIDRITLQERAVATSAPMGMMLAPAKQLGHILDPRNGTKRPKRQLVSISAHSAAVADGLSTACCLLSRADIDTCLAYFADAELETLI